MTITTHSAVETKKFAGLLAREISKTRFKTKSALVIALYGNLGTGKTTFVQGFLRGLGVKSKITSPTFVLIKNYELRIKNYGNAYHVDCYRIKKPAELTSLGIKEIIDHPNNIALVEWPERIKNLLPKNALKINFRHGKKENERLIAIK